MKFKIKFCETSSKFKCTFKELHIVSDGGFEKGYSQGFADGKAEAQAKNLFADYAKKTIAEVKAEDWQGMTELHSHMFYQYTALKKVTLAEGCKSILEYAFWSCSNLESVYLPQSLTSIGSFVFPSCNKLKEVNISATNCTKIGMNTFSSCKALESISLPDTLQTLSNGVFGYCTSLKTVAFGSGISNLSSTVFSGCEALQSVDFSRATAVPKLENKNSFTNVPTTCKIVVPDSLYDTWKNATNWSALTQTYVKASEYTGG